MIPSEIFNVVKLDKAFTSTDCDAILEMSGALDMEVGQVASGAGTYIDTTYRKSSAALLEKDDSTEWIYKRVQQLVMQCNETYKFKLEGMEMLQVAEYNQGEYYRPHMDLGPGHAKFRKLSIVVQLSDSDDYGGGDLNCLQPEAQCSREKGSALVFPSFCMHGVTQVTSGTRYSLAGWFTGPRFS